MGVFLVLLGGIFWAISGVLAEYLFKNNYSVDCIKPLYKSKSFDT